MFLSERYFNGPKWLWAEMVWVKIVRAEMVMGMDRNDQRLLKLQKERNDYEIFSVFSIIL